MELIIAISIGAIILSSVFSVFLFGMQSFRSGVERSEIQSNLRSVKDFLIEELRWAIEIEILNNVSSFESNWHYIVRDNYTIKHVFNNTESYLTLNDIIIEELQFDVTSDDTDLLCIEITEQNYSIVSYNVIRTLNADLSPGSGNALRYKRLEE